jgi:predicted protein tyrosine phosphatase
METARMSEEGLDRLDRAMARLIQAHQQALETCEVGLNHNAPTPQAEQEQLYRMVLEDVRAILVSASADVQDILGG